MADKMMRIAGRGVDGTAKPLNTDNRGNLINSGIVRSQRMIDGANSTIKIELGEGYSLPIIDWEEEPTDSIYYSFHLAQLNLQLTSYVRMVWESANHIDGFGAPYSVVGKLTDVKYKGSDKRYPVTDVLHRNGRYGRLTIFVEGSSPRYIRSVTKNNVSFAQHTPAKSYTENASLETEVGESETDFSFMANTILYLTNDGDSDIKFNFNDPLNYKGAFTLKAGESLNQVDLVVNKLYAQSQSGQQPFRVLGVM